MGEDRGNGRTRAEKRDRAGKLDADTGPALTLPTASRRRVDESGCTSPEEASAQIETEVTALVSAVAKRKKRSIADHRNEGERNRRSRHK